MIHHLLWMLLNVVNGIVMGLTTRWIRKKKP
jgi:hypothetical protein